MRNARAFVQICRLVNNANERDTASNSSPIAFRYTYYYNGILTMRIVRAACSLFDIV